MKRKHLWLLVGTIATVTLLLVITGIVLDKTEYEKVEGLSNSYDVSSQDTIAYVTYNRGKPQLRLYNKKMKLEKKILQLDVTQTIVDPSFSVDGSQLAFIIGHKDPQINTESSVQIVDLRTKKVEELFVSESLITELDFAEPNNGPSLFYIEAGVFKNYSDIASKQPHELDIYEYNLQTKDSIKRTNFKKYALTSLEVTPDGKYAYIQTDDDKNVKTAEDIFNGRTGIFKMELNSTVDPELIHLPRPDIDVYDFAITPDGNEVVFQAVSGSDHSGTYIYDLFSYHFNTQKETQLTDLREYTEKPVFSQDGKDVYFLVDRKFAQSSSDYHLYKIDKNGMTAREMTLPGIEK